MNQRFIVSFLLTDVIKEHEDLFWKCKKKNTENLKSKIFKTKNGRLIMPSKCTECGFKKSIFVKEQKAKTILNSLGLKTRLSKIPLFGDIFF